MVTMAQHTRSAHDATAPVNRAPVVEGKFLAVDGRRFLVKGVTYGTFAPDPAGDQFPPADRLAEDFSRMAQAGVNTVRVYTTPRVALLDEASRQGLRVLVGLSWPQHLPFLDDPPLVLQIRQQVADTVRRLAGHPAVLLFALGNEIPAGIVRWHGPRRVENFLRDLYDTAKDAVPDALFTYVNFPPTEHLNLDCFDVCAFNVYLHREPELRRYLSRLQHIAGTRPLLLAEAGADSVREGLAGQARITSTHVRAAFEEGACGAVVYSWTDEWWRGGQTITDWAFGLVDEARDPKPALRAVSEAFGAAPFARDDSVPWPKVSVVVCAYDAADTIDDCIDSLTGLTYPDVEVIVVNDGSHDETSDLARRHTGVHVIDVQNGGLGAARNVGLAAATGDIVAYTDADCRVDPDWLSYLVQPLLTSDVVGAGGPNVIPADDPWAAQCIARAPGGPTHVMLDDRIAEHVPGCNMAFRRDELLAIDGFNPVYLRAGDDVDICWRLQARDLQIAFAPSALVWHHRRANVRAYWRQQVGYGEGETWLDAHHPEKFLAGQMLWHGRIYSPLPFVRGATGRRVNSGVWGTAAFPSIYTTQARQWHYLPHSPAWMVASSVLLLIGIFGPLAGMDAAWLPLVAGSVGWITTILRCVMAAAQSDLSGVRTTTRLSARQGRWLSRGLIAWLHIIQPIARVRGRLRGLERPARVTPQHVTRYPWKTPLPTLRDALASGRLLAHRGTEKSYWGQTWTAPTTLLTELVGVLRASRPAQLVVVDEGWRPDRDLSLAIGRWGWLHVRTVVEEHENGCCLFRVRARLRPSFVGTVRGLLLAALFAGGTSASMALYTPSVSVVVSIAAMAAIGARATWQTLRGVVALDRAITRVTTAAGMVVLPVSPAVSTVDRAERTASDLRSPW